MPLEGMTISHLGIVCLNLGNPAEAVKYLLYGTQVDPLNADNYFMLAQVYFAQAEKDVPQARDQAWRNVEIALKIDPYYAEVYELRGRLLEREGKLVEAAQMYEQAFYVNPTLPSPLFRMEVLGRRVGRLDTARRLVKEAAAKFPENIELYRAQERLK
jgi:tetratricopeptide (TPR) repeat protein